MVSGFSYPILPVAYLNISLRPGFNLISVPLKTSDSDIAGMFATQVNLPDGLTVYAMEEGEFHGTTYIASTKQFEPVSVAMERIPPGRAFFVYNPLQTQFTLVFAGEIPQGRLTNSLPAGFSAVAPMVPRDGTLTLHGFPTEPGDIVYTWDATNQRFGGSTYDDIDNAWLPGEVMILPGEGFILFKRHAVDWIVDFVVNP
jgi:hypothetical protein